jgi:PIN domain nuclease of toxin-antitoxin system
MIYIDTHVIVWLFEGRIEKFSEKAQVLIEENSILASPMSILELQYLQEIKRITPSAHEIVDDLVGRIDLLFDENAFANVVKKSLTFNWTRDPFDRLITAGAELQGIPFLTKDRTIRENCSLAVWD